MQTQIDLHSTSSWQTDLRYSLKTYSDIKKFFELDYEFSENYSCLIPNTFAQKIKRSGVNSPLWHQFIPTQEEDNPEGFFDPIGDKKAAKGNGIIQKYKNRILFTPTAFCPVSCRYCFRKNQLNSQDEIFKYNLISLKDYLVEHPEIDEVILTGGDPLMLNNNKLIQLFEALSLLKIKFLRIHTRTPIILPNRINDGLVKAFNDFSDRFKKIIFVLHTNHIDEIDEEVEKALLKLKGLPIKKLTQSVLLKKVNDSKKDLINLFNKVLDIDFTPYYLHHPDMAKGAMHFYLPVEHGRIIYNQLRDDLPGWAIPHYIIDHHLGGGKQLAFNPESIDFSGTLLNKDGNPISF